MKTLCAILARTAIAALTPLSAQQKAFRGSLAEYLALDEDGVTIGNSTFHHFRILPIQDGAGSLSTQFIDVVPVTDTEGEPGFRFEIMDGATVDDFFELRFTFEASGPGFVGAKIELNNVNVRASSNASADVLLDLSESGSPAGSLASLVAFAAPEGLKMLEDRTTFTGRSSLTVEIDTVLDGGNEGVSGVVVASVGAIAVTFTEARPIAGLPVINKSGLLNATTFFIEFTSTPSTTHEVSASTTLADQFPISVTPLGGNLTTDASGFGRVEFDISALPGSAYFTIKRSS